MGPLVLPIINLVGGILDKFITNKADAEKAKLELLVAAQSNEFNLALKQVEVNVEEAKHQSVFVAGWRPFLGWVCGIALCYHFVGYPLMNWFIEIYKPDFVAPELDTSALMELVIGMLGLAGLRTFEKVKNAT